MTELLGWAFFGGLALLIFAIFVGLSLSIIITLCRAAPPSEKTKRVNSWSGR